MKRSIRFSIVIPVYNVERYLDKCVQSFMDQTIQPYEIILVDDGSTDSSGALCDKWANKSSIVKVIHKDNAGLGFARNTGIESVSGDYVIFIDSDDYCDIDFIENIYKGIESTDACACKTVFRRVDIEGNFVSEDKPERKLYQGEAVLHEFIPKLLGSSPEKSDSLPMSACCTAYSMDIIRSNHLSFRSEREWISEDAIFNIEYMAKCNSVLVLDYVGYNYRINPKSLSTSYRPDRLEQFVRLTKAETQMLEEYGVKQEGIIRVYRQYFVDLTMCFIQLKKSSLTFSERISEITKCCSHQWTQEVISQYPEERMDFKHRTFLWLVKRRMAAVLYFFYCL